MRLLTASAIALVINACSLDHPSIRLNRMASVAASTADHEIWKVHGAAERQLSVRSTHLPYGDASKRDTFRHPWPVRVQSIGHNNASFQDYGGSPYFHHGLDIRAEAGENVFASAGGLVVNIENYFPGDPAYWEVAILDEEGFLWQYHHVDRDSIPDEIFTAYRGGRSIAAGTKIGQVYRWTVSTFGEVFHHIHLNVLGADKKFLSPFDFLEMLPDHQAPAIVDIGLLKSGQKHPGRTVSGDYSLYATIHDLVMHHQFVVPPHLVTIRINQHPPATVWHFADLPGGASIEEHVQKFFVPSMTCGDYRCRKLTIDLGFLKNGARRFPASPGNHSIEVVATDYNGNESVRTFSWQVL